MGFKLLQIDVLFSPREVAWLYSQAEKNGVTVQELIRRRSLKRDEEVLDEESYQRFVNVVESGCGVKRL